MMFYTLDDDVSDELVMMMMMMMMMMMRKKMMTMKMRVLILLMMMGIRDNVTSALHISGYSQESFCFYNWSVQSESRAIIDCDEYTPTIALSQEIVLDIYPSW